MSRRREEPAGLELEVEGSRITLSHPDKALWPDDGITKADLARYYLEVAPLVLPFLEGRPLTLKPYPRGIDGPSFFLRTRPESAPEWLASTPYHVRTEDQETR